MKPEHDLDDGMALDTKGIPGHGSSLKDDLHRVQIKNVDMPEEMQTRAVQLAKTALSQQMSPREIAGSIKKEFDRLYGSPWHCIVGKAFGSYVTHGTLSQVFLPINGNVL